LANAPKDHDELTKEEIERRRDKIARRMLNTPPHPRNQPSVPLFADIGPLLAVLEEAVSLLGPQFGLHFLNHGHILLRGKDQHSDPLCPPGVFTLELPAARARGERGAAPGAMGRFPPGRCNLADEVLRSHNYTCVIYQGLQAAMTCGNSCKPRTSPSTRRCHSKFGKWSRIVRTKSAMPGAFAGIARSTGSLARFAYFRSFSLVG